MTFDELVDETLSRLNLTSIDARARIGRYINKRYKWVTSGIGLQTSKRKVFDRTVNPTIDATLPDVVIVDTNKIIRITRSADSGGITTLMNPSYDEVTNQARNSALPRAWAVKRMGSTSVVITLDTFTVEPFVLHIEGYELSPTLADDAEPAFPEEFHDILVEGAIADELRKMEKPALSDGAEGRYRERISDLRYYIAKAAYQDIYQGKVRIGYDWLFPWYGRTAVL